jgi:hypothetical protein
VPETSPASATFQVIAGLGPNPAGNSLPSGYLENDDSLTITLTAGGDGHFESFSRLVGDAGDAFTLDTASQAMITGIPTDGTSFTIGCDGAGGSCGTAISSILTITTTDGAIAGVPPDHMPPPSLGQVVVRCVQIGATSITVPAEASSFLSGSGATRIQTMFSRVALQNGSNAGAPEASYTLDAGHGVIGYTTP